MEKSKSEMRKEAVERLGRLHGVITTLDIVNALTNNRGGHWINMITDLLTDDEPPYEGDAFAKGPRDANGILWFRGDMSDSPWGVIECTYFDGDKWMVRGHDISAPWIPADSIAHALMRTATQRENDLVDLLRDAARDYESLQADCRGMSDLKDTCWQKFKDLHEAVDERYIELPRDKYGEPWHVGDVTENGNVVMGMTIDNTGEWYFINTRNDIDPHAHYHYRRPTVDEILDELEGMRGTGDYDAVVERCADLAGMLRELLKEDGNEVQA